MDSRPAEGSRPAVFLPVVVPVPVAVCSEAKHRDLCTCRKNARSARERAERWCGGVWGRTAPCPASRTHLLAGVQGEEQGGEARGGVPPVALHPVVMDILEESWAQDEHLSGEQRSHSCSLCCHRHCWPCHQRGCRPSIPPAVPRPAETQAWSLPRGALPAGQELEPSKSLPCFCQL